MDAERFDAIARSLGARATRRIALGGLIGAGLVGAAATNASGKTRSGKKRKQRRTGSRRPRAQRDCANPGPAKNLNGCDFAGRNFNGRNLSGSTISDATFRNAELIDANLSDSILRGTSFRGANLCSANVSSSSLKQADFRGSDGPDGRPTNLTRADLRDSGCGGVMFDSGTIFCATTMCNGAVRNNDCPAGVDPDDVCCANADCGPGRICRNGACVPDPGTCTAGQDYCRDGHAPCGDQPGCNCYVTTSSEAFCGDKGGFCSNCSKDEDCTEVTGLGSACIVTSSPVCGCGSTHRRACQPPCGQQCANNAQCGNGRICCDGTCENECCTTADCGAHETCAGGRCICQGCIGRINSQCKAGNAWAECGAHASCAECHRDQVCAADSQTCVGCEFGRVGGTWCDARDDFARYQCGRNCACATNPQGFGACFNTSVAGYCNRGREPICEFAADCVIEGLGTDCIVVGGCETCTTACVTRCASDETSGDGPLQLVVLDE